MNVPPEITIGQQERMLSGVSTGDVGPDDLRQALLRLAYLEKFYLEHR